MSGVSGYSYKETPEWRKRNEFIIHIPPVECPKLKKKSSIENHKQIHSYIGPITMQQGYVFKNCVQMWLCNGAHTKVYDNASTHELLCG